MFDTKYRSAADYDLVIRLCLKKYKSVFVDKAFVTYQFGGVSSTAQENSLRETANIWRLKYSDLYPITDGVIESMRTNIYSGNYYNGIPIGLARKFSAFKPFFNYAEYLNSTGQKDFRVTISSITRKCYSRFKKVLNK